MSCYKDHIKGKHHGCWNCKHQTKSSTEEFRGVKPRCKNCVHLMQHCQWEREQ